MASLLSYYYYYYCSTHWVSLPQLTRSVLWSPLTHTLVWFFHRFYLLGLVRFLVLASGSLLFFFSDSFFFFFKGGLVSFMAYKFRSKRGLGTGLLLVLVLLYAKFFSGCFCFVVFNVWMILNLRFWYGRVLLFCLRGVCVCLWWLYWSFNSNFESVHIEFSCGYQRTCADKV